METLSTINREDGVTVVVSLHQIDHAFKHCKRIVALKDGEVAYDGPTSDISPQQIASLYGVEGLDLMKDEGDDDDPERRWPRLRLLSACHACLEPPAVAFPHSRRAWSLAMRRPRSVAPTRRRGERSRLLPSRRDRG